MSFNPFARLSPNSTYSYTRDQALADGYLVPITRWTREAGFPYDDAAITSAAWLRAVEWNITNRHRTSMVDRYRDVALMAAVEALPSGLTRTDFTVNVVPNTATATKPAPITLRLVIGPSDDGTSVLTIMLPEED